MENATYKNYLTDKAAFMERHGYDYRVELHRRDAEGKILKEYVFGDGARWSEVTSVVHEQCEIEVPGLACKAWAEVQLIKTDYWVSEDEVSGSFYEACALDKYSR